MKMVKAIVRPEKVSDILVALVENKIYAATRSSVLGRGKQQGLKVGNIHYEEIPKECISIVVEDEQVDLVVSVISNAAKTGKEGAYGDGKIFVLPVEMAVTISSGEAVL
jgi:nitrogen regulatory protein PII 1